MQDGVEGRRRAGFKYVAVEVRLSCEEVFILDVKI